MQPEFNQKPLPKPIAQMVQKNNLVLAIKTLAEQEDISMAAAKTRIDAYEAKLKEEQIKQQQRISHAQKHKNKQHLTSDTDGFTSQQTLNMPHRNKRLLLIVMVMVIVVFMALVALGWVF